MIRQTHFLNAADSTLFEQSSDEFDRSLLLNILFSDRIVVPDTYFFHSSPIAKHMNSYKPSQSWFETACREGVIVPAFGSTNQGSLADSIDAMKDKYGRDYEAISDSMKEHSRILVRAVDSGMASSKGPFIWAQESSRSEAYERVLREVLQIPIPASFDGVEPSDELRRAWKKTELWRHKLIDQAALTTASKGHKGVQRTDVFNALGWSLGVPQTKKTVFAEDIVRVLPGNIKPDVALFLKWIAHCKHFSDACAAGVPADLPLFDPIREPNIVLNSGYAKNRQSEGSGRLQFEFEFPPLDTILARKPDDLIAMRKRHLPRYLADLREWTANPSDLTEKHLRSSFAEYTGEIVELHKDDMISKSFYNVFKGHEVTTFLLTMGTASASLLGYSAVATVASTSIAYISFVASARRYAARKTEKRQMEIVTDSSVVK